MAMSGHENADLSRRVDREDDVTRSVITGGAVTSALAGIAAAVLAILAFSGIYPLLFAIIATICVGVAFLLEGSAIASRASHLVTDPVNRRESGTIGGGMALGSLAGIAGIALGVLALLDYQPLTMLSIAAIVYGAGVLFESGALASLNTFFRGYTRSRALGDQSADPALSATIGIDVICGLAGIALGILALLGYFEPLTLVLSAMLIFGCAMLLSGAVVASKVRSFLGYGTRDLRA